MEIEGKLKLAHAMAMGKVFTSLGPAERTAIQDALDRIYELHELIHSEDGYIASQNALIEEIESAKIAYHELEQKYFERGCAMHETGNMVRSLYTPYLQKIKAALKNPDDLEALTIIAGEIKKLEAHTYLGGSSED